MLMMPSWFTLLKGLRLADAPARGRTIMKHRAAVGSVLGQLDAQQHTLQAKSESWARIALAIRASLEQYYKRSIPLLDTDSGINRAEERLEELRSLVNVYIGHGGGSEEVNKIIKDLHEKLGEK